MLHENIGSFLTRRARRGPNLEAIVEPEKGRRSTYAELNARSNQAAAALLANGIRKGDRVAILLTNRAEFVESYFAAAKIGAIVVPLNWRLVADELQFILKDSGAIGLIYDLVYDATAETLRARDTDVKTWIRVGGTDSEPHFRKSYENLLAAHPCTEPALGASDDDLLFIMYTSGTTGRPKGVMQTHETMLWASTTWNMTCDMRYLDRHLIVLPLFHIGGLLPLTAAIHRGQTVVVLHSADPDNILRTIAQEKVNVTHIVTTMLRRILTQSVEQPDRTSLRWAIVGGEAVPPGLTRQAAKAGIEVLQDYGLTEACGPVTIATSEDAREKADSCGGPHFHTEVRVIAPDDREVAPGEVGEVVVRSRHIMKGYWNRPDATAEALKDGWLYTGDLGAIDDDGSLSIRDRKKDMVISGGENIYPAEVERVISSHPKVKEVAIIGQPSGKWGESPVAVVVTKNGAGLNTEEIIAFCRGKIAGYKIPRHVEFVDELPRTPTGKIQKHLLRVRFPGPAPQ